MKDDQVAWFQSQFRRPRFTLAEVGWVVAAFAVALRWPPLVLPTVAYVLSLAMHKSGVSLALMMVVASVLGFLAGLLMPPVTSNCTGRIRPAAVQTAGRTADDPGPWTDDEPGDVDPVQRDAP
jgi:hypothetical protein